LWIALGAGNWLHGGVAIVDSVVEVVRDACAALPDKRRGRNRHFVMADIVDREPRRPNLSMRSSGDSTDRDTSPSVFSLKHDDDFRRLGFVRRQTGQMHIGPVGKVYHCRRPRARLRLDNIQSVAVEEKRLVAEQFVQQ